MQHQGPTTHPRCAPGFRGAFQMSVAPEAGSLHSLQSVPFFRDFGSADFRGLLRTATTMEMAAPSQIFGQGDPPDSAYFIASGEGCVRIGASDRQGKALMVEVFQVGDLFGEIGVIEDKPRTASAVVEGRIRLLRIPAPAFRDALGSNLTFASALCRTLARRLRRTFELFQDATFESLEVRLARQILYLADVAGRADKSGQRLVRRVRQGDLADLLGVTNRSIITILNAWRSSGMVSYDTRTAMLTVTNRSALQGLLPSAPSSSEASAIGTLRDKV